MSRPLAVGALGVLLVLAGACAGDDARPSPPPDSPPRAAIDAGGAGSRAPAGDAGRLGQGDAAIDAGPDSLPDGGAPGCAPECPEGDLRCTGERVERCAPDDDGCVRFLLVEDCAIRDLACVQTDTSAGCAPGVQPSCSDGEWNQDETDVDCGGEACDPCAIERACRLDRDCAEGVCFGGRCVAEAPACSDGFAPPTGYAAPYSLAWPIVSKQSGAPRAALGNTFGEFQQYGGAAAYLHSGIDIRGLQGDYVRVVADGNIWLTANLATCEDNAGTTCRLYILDTAGRYIYYYSHLRLSAADPLSVELRDKITNASQRGSGSYAVNPGTDVTAGETLSAIADFAGNQWAHLHFGIFDATENYDGIHPLLALDAGGQEPPIVDDESPLVSAIELRADASAGPALAPGRCDEVSGAVDVIATIGDAFFTADPAPESVPGTINSIGVYGARTVIRNVQTGESEELPWYDFARAPFDCAGPARGAACPVQLSRADFLARSVDTSDGAPLLGLGFTPLLFDAPGSSSDYSGVERYRHIMTHGFGEPGAWDTTAGADGLYQISVEASDHAGNRAALSRLVVVDNAGTLDPQATRPDALVRDSPSDSGALPSTLGNAPFWTSPDIFVVAAGGSVDLGSEPSDPELLADADYDVYVRVHNAGCAPIAGVRVRLSSLAPDLGPVAEAEGRVAITDPAAFVGDPTHPGGLDLAPGAAELLGPFAWTPSAAELAPFGARALLAEIDAPEDPHAPSADVLADNNAALRSVQLRAGAARAQPSFWLGQPGPGGACVQLVVEHVGLPLQDPATEVVLELAYDPLLERAWTEQPGALFEHDAQTGTSRVRVSRARVALPPLGLPAATRWPGSVLLRKPAGAPAGSGVRFSLYRDGVLTGGVDVR